MINIFCLNNNSEIEISYGCTLFELAEKQNIKLEKPILGALINNQVRSLNYKIHKSCFVNFFDITSTYGNEMYNRSLYFVLYKAVHDLYPEATLKILHSISGGKYCELDRLSVPLTTAVVEQIVIRMKEIIAADLPFQRRDILTEIALQEYEKLGFPDDADIFKDRKKLFTTIYQLDDVVNFYYNRLLTSTKYLTLFSLELYETGLLLKSPNRKHPDSISTTRFMPKLFAVYKEFKEWGLRIGVPYLNDLNKRIENKTITDLILMTEAFQEKSWANIADEIKRRNAKMILISGPSSSGKTTSCKRLSVQLSVLDYHPIQISVDDFFVERELTPKDIHGNYDFEILEAVDLHLFNKTLQELLEGKEVELPTFNFTAGKKEWKGNKILMKENSILVIEGIHCLNPKLTSTIDDSWKYKIFVSALTSLSIDKLNPIPTTDSRLIRRIIRDNNYRGYTALDTLRRWESVRDGEEKNIFPYQENADIMFNTSLLYELGVLRPYALPVLLEVPETEPEYAEAARLIRFLSYFKSISEELIPGTSILREFVGGSKFKY